MARRFSNFQKLYDDLVREQGAAHVPPLPDVSFAGRLEPAEIRRREQLLTQFLSDCHRAFPFSDVIATFLTQQDAYPVESSCTLL